jgi:beta-alanine degradation protein BauB
MSDSSNSISSPVPMPAVGTRLLFENERVRVWDLSLAPGETLPLHRHELDYLYVVIGGGSLQTGFADGTADEPRQMADGEVRFREVASPGDAERATHSATNVGPTPWRNIVVELK